MKLVSPVLKHIVYPGLARSGYLRRHASDGPTVLTYHGVFPDKYRFLHPDLDGNLVSAVSLRAQFELLKTHYSVISPEEFLSWCRSQHSLPPRSVLLTCDDGLQNVLNTMLPILQEYALSCLFFVTGASFDDDPAMLWYEELYLMLLDGPKISDLKCPEIGLQERAVGRDQKRTLWWKMVKKFSQFSSTKRSALLQQIRIQLGLSEEWRLPYIVDTGLRARFGLLTLTELRQLADSGMSIGAHTLSHPVLSRQPPELSWEEISETRRVLANSLGRPIWAMAYPFGDPASVSPRECEMARRAGFECAFLNVENTSTMKMSHFAFPRIHVTADMGLSEFEAHVSGFYRTARQYFKPRNSEPVFAS